MTARIHIAGREVGDGCPAYVIAEGGVNHSGQVGLAVKLVHAAAEAGADACKWQKRTPALHADPTKLRESCAFPEGQLVTELQHREALELSATDYELVSTEAEAVGLDCFASAWDLPSVDFLAEFHPPAWKVASASVTDLELLEATRDAARKDGAAIIASTGMSTLAEIDRMVDVLGREQLALLHCVSSYPMADDEANLACIQTLRERYRVPVGWSGHERGVPLSTWAVARWRACIVERHLTLDRAMRGSDHAASLEPKGLALLIRDIRMGEAADGHGRKEVGERERAQIARLRRKK